MIKVSILEDNEIIQNGIKALLNLSAGYHFVSAYYTAETMLNDVVKHPPDVLLVDIQLPGINGIEAIRRLRKTGFKGKVAVLTVYSESSLVIEAICAGADGYILKGTEPGKIIESIEELYKGGSPLNAGVASKILSLVRDTMHKDGGKVSDENQKLKEIEATILEMAANGYSFSEIAPKINLSVHTVKYHVRNIYQKLQTTNMPESIAKAIRKNLI